MGIHLSGQHSCRMAGPRQLPAALNQGGAQLSPNPHLQFQCQGCCALSPSPGCLQTDVEMKPRRRLPNRCPLTLLEAGKRRGIVTTQSLSSPSSDHPFLPAPLWQSPPQGWASLHPCSESTCSSSSLSRCSWDSSCLLWSSRICMRVSRRLLCCRRIRASARSSSLHGSCMDSGELVAKVGDSTASSCCHFKRLSSPWRILRDSLRQHHHSEIRHPWSLCCEA